MQAFILAASASGKGIANQALEMVRVVDEQYPMLIAGDSTLAAWYKALEERGGSGYMHESEGSVITDIWKTAAANYNTALRKAAEHEAISRNRCTGASEIKCPKMSMLLTGTFNQYRALVPSVENGYFSRLLTLVIRETHPFDKRYVSTIGGQSAVPQQAGRELLRVYEQLARGGEREWSLTEEQKTRLGEHLETEYGTLIGLLGDNFHSAVVRMAVQIERIALILTALRGDSILMSRAHNKIEPEYNSGLMDKESRITSGTTDETIYCQDEDYQTAEMIGNKLLLHMAAAYRMIDGESQELVPEIKPLDQRKVLFEQLPEVYAHKELVAEAKAQGVSQATATRWNERWLEQGDIKKIKYGIFKKVV
ncbi:MAG: DUF3987 domain-containing protein [Paludibacteraceae bacterium]|nr:DUF3987 domain-containing protein [Paludibacteraceae bacterium]